MGLLSKLSNFNECRINSSIYSEYYNSKIDDSIIFVESRNGSDFTGNLFRIVEELSTGKYGNYKIYVYATDNIKNKINQLKKNYDLNISKVITDDNEACRVLAKSKYILTDSGINFKYVKKEGQIFINTWHGTPLKLMGFDNSSEQTSMSIVQRSFLFSDYLLFPNEYMKEKMLKAYMIDKIYPGKILLEGYPRNSVFFNETQRNNLRNKLNLENYEIYSYMPTFKGLVNDRKDDKQRDDVNHYLKEIDHSLNDNQILFVKLHPYNQAKIDFKSFNNIKEFPVGYDVYDILNITDCLITDYSSVFFDFANSRRKIIIFNYDEKEYLKDRGLYFSLDELPFAKVQNVSELIGELNLNKDYDDSEFVNKFGKYERENSTKYICESIFTDKISCKYEIIDNSNKNILVYAGSLLDNDNLNSLTELLDNVNYEKYNIFISFCHWDKNIDINHEKIFKKLPDNVQYLPISYNLAPTISEKIDYDKFLKNKTDSKFTENLENLFKRSYKRQFGEFEFDGIIDFGFDLNETLMLSSSGKNYYLLNNTYNISLKNIQICDENLIKDIIN